MGVRGRSPVRDYILILIGASIMGFAIKNIYDPIGLVTGGVSGVAIILKKQLGMPLWLTNTAINVPLFAAAARLKGWKFIRRTLVATVALSVSLYVIPEIPFLMDDLLLTALFGGIITGAGAGIVFACQATTGGTDMPLDAALHHCPDHAGAGCHYCSDRSRSFWHHLCPLCFDRNLFGF